MSDPKATINDLLDEGFVDSQFGMPADWAAAGTGYLARVLASASLWVEQKCGAPAYAALADGSYAEDCARHAEVQYASMVLFRRRYAVYDGNAAAGLNKDVSMLLAELRKKAQEAQQNAVYWLGEAMRASGVSDDALYDGTGMASGVVETGVFRPVTRRCA